LKYTAGLLCSHGFELHLLVTLLWRRKRRREVKEKSPSAQVAAIACIIHGVKINSHCIYRFNHICTEIMNMHYG